MVGMDEKILVTRSSIPPYEEYIEAIKPLWESHWLTNMGKYHQELEQKLEEYLDVPQISLTVNGHMALELAIQAFDFPEGGEVITTPFTFISTTHAIVRNRLRPVFCDVKESDGTIDENKIENLITENTVAILPVHVFGNACNVDAIKKIADRNGLKVIYDAAHAFGESYKGRGVGNYGDASIFSFHATKVFHTIEGGSVVCKTQELYDKLYNLKNFGIRGEENVVSVGANAKMNEFCAIMGLLNLDHIDEAIKDRKRVFEYYKKRLADCPNVRILYGAVENRNYGYLPIVLEGHLEEFRDLMYDRLKENGIHCRKYFYPLTSEQRCFSNQFSNADVSHARKLSESVLALPMFDYVMANHVLEHIVDEEKAVRELMRVLRQDGVLILSFPINMDADTDEDENVADMTAEERLERFGQEDHVRLYGRDYKERFERYGLDVMTYSPCDILSDEEIERLGFIYDDAVMICRVKM